MQSKTQFLDESPHFGKFVLRTRDAKKENICTHAFVCSYDSVTRNRSLASDSERQQLNRRPLI